MTDVSATAGGGVDGTSVANAAAGLAGTAAKFATTGQATAHLNGAPTASTSNAILNASGDGAIKSAFGATPVFFGVGELGGGYSKNGKASQTITSQFSETVDLTKLGSRQDLEVGLYGGAGSGAGVTKIQFDLVADGIDVLSKTFSSAAAAQAFFTNDAIDLGSLASGAALGADSLTLSATLSVTSSSARSGFYGGILLGETSPAPEATIRPVLLTQAMAQFSARGGGHLATMDSPRLAQPLIAAPTRCAMA